MGIKKLFSKYKFTNKKMAYVVSIFTLLVLGFQNCGQNFASLTDSRDSGTAEESGVLKFSSENAADLIIAESNYGYFKNLSNVPIRSGGAGFVESNVEVLSGLPSEGALLTIQELQGAEQNAQGHFSFKVNNEPNWFGQNAANRRLFNGDRLKMKALASYYFDTTLRVKYSIGTVMSSEWAITTQSDPGTLASFSNSNQITRDVSVGEQLLSSVLTVSGLGQNVLVPIEISGAGGQEELLINGVLKAANTIAQIKNGDRMQIRYRVKTLDTIRMRIYSVPVGIRGNLQVRNAATWSIFPKGIAVVDQKVQITCSGTITIKDEAFCQVSGLQSGDKIDWYVNGEIIDYLKNLSRISTTEPQLGRHTFSARITHSNGDIEYTDEKIILVR